MWFSGWAARRGGDDVERATQVPDLHGAAEAGDRGRRPARGRVGEGAVPAAPDRRDAVLLVAREAARGWPRGAGWEEERRGERELKRRIAQLERALGRKTYELEIAGELSR